ncbi:MAG: hypothetical protein KA140_08025 [Caldisericia bacterium]|nr:hypothetical protein [Caldisericia bacterium]
MIDLFLEFQLKNRSSAAMLEQFRIYLTDKNKDVLNVTVEDVNQYRDHLLQSYSVEEATERLLVISEFYKFMSKRAFKAQLLKNIGIILLQAFAIYASSVWIVPKYQWPSILWLDDISSLLFGTTKIFYLPGFIGTLVTLGVMFVLLARGWLERPRNWLGWIVLILDWWILAVLYGLVIGDESLFLSGGLNNYLIIAAFTAFILGFREIVGLAFIVLMVLAGFQITSISSIIVGMSFPYLLSLTILIFAQSPEVFDRILGWINKQFLTGKAQAATAEVAKSVESAAYQIKKTAGLLVDKLSLPGKTKMFD